MSRNNDWSCPSCQDRVFGSKAVCKCGYVRDAATMKPGDWICPGCSGVVFASKDKCGKCYTPKPSRNNAPQQQNFRPQQQASPMQKPGDWFCPGCNGLVFASKDRCGKCGASKPNPNLYSNSVNQPLTHSTNPFSTFVNTDVNYNINVQYPSTNPFAANLGQSVGGGANNYSNNNTNNVNMNGGAVVKPGDWRCSACNENNFASRQICFKCRAARPGSNISNANIFQQQALQAQPAKFAGDWNCKCGASNFGSRTVCYKCAAPRLDLSASNKSDTGSDEGLCVICICEPSCYAIQDCGHLCLCQGCANNGQVNTCPMCRAPVRAVMKVFKA